VGRRLKACVREVDTAARLGGDEFVVVFDQLSGDGADVDDKARTVAEKIRGALAQPYHVAGDHAADAALTAVTCTASIGVAMFAGAGAGLGAVEAMRAADLAMYEAKRAGGNQVKMA
jgi:diguanylate cyclase (GGDEF)-like protein